MFQEKGCHVSGGSDKFNDDAFVKRLFGGEMAIRTNYHVEIGVLYIDLGGVVTVEEIENLYKEITSSDEYPPTVRSLWDFRKVDFTFVTNEFIDQIFAVRKKYHERGSAKAAFLVESDLAFGVSRMYETLSSFELPQHIMVFKEMAKAEEWLLTGR